MSFEIKYFYHERKADGGYNTDEKKEITKKIGKLYEEIPLDKLAKLILSQLARRDIWVVDVELQEHVKRKIAFKEASDGNGIVIKGKKFTVDNTEGTFFEDYNDDVEDIELSNITKNVVQTLINKPEKNINTNKVLFTVLFTPEEHQIDETKSKKLTINKKYSVFRQDDNGILGSTYYITNDIGKIVEINEKYFTFPPKGLIGGREFNEEQRPENNKLLYQNSSHNSYNRRSIDRSMIPPEYAHLPIDGDDSIQYDDNVPNLRPMR